MVKIKTFKYYYFFIDSTNPEHWQIAEKRKRKRKTEQEVGRTGKEKGTVGGRALRKVEN